MTNTIHAPATTLAIKTLRRPAENEAAWRTQLRDPEPEVRQLALIELEETLDHAALGPLLEALSDEDATVRRLAIERLEDLGDPRAAAPLVAALTDPTDDVREAAAMALRELRDPAALEPLLH